MRQLAANCRNLIFDCIRSLLLNNCVKKNVDPLAIHWTAMKVLLLLLNTIAITAGLQKGADVLTSLVGGNCTSPEAIEVFGAEIADCNGIYERPKSVPNGTTASCFSWTDKSKPYYILNQTAFCSSQGLIDLYFSNDVQKWKMSKNGVEVYQAVSISGPWMTTNASSLSPPTSVACYGRCDMPRLTWQVRY